MTLGPSQVEATVDVAPFDLRPEAGTETGSVALCLHGLTGTPYEVRPVAEALVSRGVRAVGIWMAGHNGTVDDLAATRHEEWVELEHNKIEANALDGDMTKSMSKKGEVKDNLGVWGKKLLPQKLEEVLEKFGAMTNTELEIYRFSHGHNVTSSY